MPKVPEWEPKRLTTFETGLVATGRAHIAFNMVMKRCAVEIRCLKTEREKTIAINAVATHCSNGAGMYYRLGKSWDEVEFKLRELVGLSHGS